MTKNDDIQVGLQTSEPRSDIAINATNDFVVVVKRKDEPGEIEWSSPANLRITIGMAEEFLSTQIGNLNYTENDLFLRNAKDEKLIMTLAEARAASLSAPASSERLNPYVKARQEGLALSDLSKSHSQQSAVDLSPQRRRLGM